jgi:hypothetical protein
MNLTTTAAPEWTRFFPADGGSRPDVLHARFVQHAYTRHTHDEYVVGLSKLACSVSTLNAAFIILRRARSS